MDETKISTEANHSEKSEMIHKNKTPEKTGQLKIQEVNNITPKKDAKRREIDYFKTDAKTIVEPNKLSDNLFEKQIKENKTPKKITGNFCTELGDKAESESFPQCDEEEGMISTTEQARLLIAVSKTPSKLTHKTPVKQHTPSGRRSVENSPVTPGKIRRVELITLSSPKAKRLKHI